VRAVSRTSAGDVGTGSTYRVVREIGGRRVENVVQVSEMVTDRTFEITSVKGPTPFVYRYDLVALSPSITRVRLSGTISAAGFSGPMALVSPLASSLFAMGMRTNLATFKRLLEGGIELPAQDVGTAA
jgi:hypothetical protein